MEKNYRYVPGAEYPYQYRYEHMAVTTDCVLFAYVARKLKILLVRRGGEPYKDQWALPGGFLRINESARDGALRELSEETGFFASNIRELGVFSDVYRDPRERVITIAYYALVKPAEVVGGDDAAEAAWFAIDELPELAFDHKKIFEAAMVRLRRDIYFEPVGFDLLDECFTIPDLHCLYETILGVKLDRRNFQRKLYSSGILEELPEKEENKAAIKGESYNCAFDNCSPSTIGKSFINTEDSFLGFMDRANLFYNNDAEEIRSHEFKKAASPPLPNSIEDSDSASLKKNRPGRTAVRFRLNRLKYKVMKDDIGKTEF